jgi:hypothetical protein
MKQLCVDPVVSITPSSGISAVVSSSWGISITFR